MSETVIKVDNVYKDFRLPHEKNTTIKSIFTNTLKGSFGKKDIETQHALKGVSFEIKKGEFFGVVGRNGSGKSTLLKILAGIYQPTKGEVEVNGRVVPFIELGVGFNAELSGKDNVYLNGAVLGFSRDEISEKYSSIVDFAELDKFMDQKLKNYSSGMQVRLAFSVATILADSDVLLIDEVLAVGDADFQRKCFDYFKNLKKQKKTVVFVSHDMNAVREYCDKAILIEKNELKRIGKTEQIAREYTKLFIDDSIDTKSTELSNNRLGNGFARYRNVKVSKNDKEIIVSAEIAANKDLDRILYGIHIVGQDGKDITATNNRLIGLPDLMKLKKGTVYSVEWSLLNIFTDGRYSITMTIADDVGRTYDWLIDAKEFTVRKENRSTTSVLPPIKVKTGKVNAKESRSSAL